MYAHVIEGAVVSEMTGPPKCTESVSGFDLFPVSEHIKHGYYPLVVVKDVFDPATHELPPMPVYTIGATEVTATYTKVAIPVEKLATALEVVRAGRIKYIEDTYKSMVSANADYMGTTFQADEESQTLIVKVLTSLGGASPAGFGWYDINNTKKLMTFAELQGLSGLLLMRGQPLFDIRQARKAEIRLATTIAEINAITWE